MILETCQMLCTVLNSYGLLHNWLMRSTHEGHPCTIWAGESQSNFIWLCQHGIALCEEKKVRYPRRPEHISRGQIESCMELAYMIPDFGITEFPQAMPDEYKGSCPHLAYRRYLEAKYLGWSKRGMTLRFREGERK